MGTYFIVRCFVKNMNAKKWTEYEYGPYMTLPQAIEIMIDHLKPISILKHGKGRLMFKATIHEVVMTEMGQWDTLQIRIEETERITHND